jgi:phage recombination protein Bet
MADQQTSLAVQPQDQLTTYTALDGTDITLSPSIVLQSLVNGAQPEPKDLITFIAKCQARKLNPLAGDCYLNAYKSQKTGKVTASVIVSKDYYVRTARNQPTCKGWQAGIVVINTGNLIYREGSMVIAGETLVGGWAKVYDARWDQPATAEVSLDEYSTGTSLWADNPAAMIRKVALVQALREAYPEMYSGVYDSSEISNE